tara:strand:+ start:10451 stop:10603 length:153 start_codon:yes stop_codon:yes gene_type:complete
MDRDTIGILLANGGALSLSLTNVHEGLQVLSLLVALIYTLIKIIKELKND